MGFIVEPDKSGFKLQGETTIDESNEIGWLVFPFLRQRIYSFVSERMNVCSCPIGFNDVLAPNASNLPEVLHVLSNRNPARFERFNQYVREIFPSIFEVRSRLQKNGSNYIEIAVWMENPETERDDLAIELSESGTGVGQVLAILYVVINSNFPQTIIIDEPNSFLHPGAARKLIEILKNRFPQHQYIISTHSPEIIKVANPETLTLIRWEKPKSVIEQLDAKQILSAQRCLTEVGANLSDVFGADIVLWVEGQTEEICFQLTLDRLAKHPLLGLAIVAVRKTGDFEGKRPSANMIWEIYSQLSSGNALIPSAIAFVFDQDSRSLKEMEDLIRKSTDRLCFLPRRMYENYLIDLDALYAVMSELPTFQQNPISKEKIGKWLSENGGKKEYLIESLKQVDIVEPDWLQKVNSAKLLKELFQELSNSQENYQKTKHSIQLTEWLIENNPNHLVELTDFLKRIVNQSGLEVLK